MHVPKSTEKGGGGGFLAPCTDLEMWKKGYFFHFNSVILHKKGMVFLKAHRQHVLEHLVLELVNESHVHGPA